MLPTRFRLNLWKALPDCASSPAFRLFQNSHRIRKIRVDRRTGQKPVRMPRHPFRMPVILQPRSVGIFPIPCLQQHALNAVCVHLPKQLFRIRPALRAFRDQLRPVRFSMAARPFHRIRDHLRGITMDMRITDRYGRCIPSGWIFFPS